MSQTDTVEETKIRLKKPNKWAVIVHNDDVTTMEFVVALLHHVFRHSEPRAVEIMREVHENGTGVAGIYTKEVAEQKLAEANALISANRQQLKLSLQEQDS